VQKFSVIVIDMLVKVRKAEKSDTNHLLALLEEARKYKVSLGDLAWGDYPYTESDIELRLKVGGYYVVELNNKIIGSIELIWNDQRNWGNMGEDNKAGYIHGLLIGDEYRGNDYGKQLIDWAIDKTALNGRQFVRLECSLKNKSLCSYYEKLGFKQVNLGQPKNSITVYYQKSIQK
jgi:ribosomal protein S18 acetylase RimI-like enzyme